MKKKCARNNEMIKMRESGKTLQEIAETFKVSKQRVAQVFEKSKVRKSNVDIESIQYKGIYDYLQENCKLSLRGFCTQCIGRCSRATYAKFCRFIKGETDSYIPFHWYIRIIAVTGKNFEELFEKRE